jgi:uncharacterized membrane protein YfcA
VIVLWFVIGLLAGVADQALGLGFGLVASIILVVFIGMDPKEAVGAILAAQALNYLLVTAKKGFGHLPKPLKMFVVLTTLITFVVPYFVVAVGQTTRRALYSLALLSAAMVLRLTKRGSLRKRYALATFALVAALDKALSGGGLSAVFVAVQQVLGKELKEAILSLPSLKLLPTLAALAGYALAGQLPPLDMTLAMFVGATLASLIAPKLLGKVRMPEWFSEALLLLAAVLNLMRVTH